MEITDVRVSPRYDGGRMKAFASVTFDNMFAVHGLRIVEGSGGLFVAMPSRKTPSGDYQDVFHPINPEGRKLISDAVLGKYQAVAGMSQVPEGEGA